MGAHLLRMYNAYWLFTNFAYDIFFFIFPPSYVYNLIWALFISIVMQCHPSVSSLVKISLSKTISFSTSLFHLVLLIWHLQNKCPQMSPRKQMSFSGLLSSTREMPTLLGYIYILLTWFPPSCPSLYWIIFLDTPFSHLTLLIVSWMCIIHIINSIKNALLHLSIESHQSPISM